MSETKISVDEKLQQLSRLVDTKHLTEWEDWFISNILEKTQNGEVCAGLSKNDSKAIHRLFDKHFR